MEESSRVTRRSGHGRVEPLADATAVLSTTDASRPLCEPLNLAAAFCRYGVERTLESTDPLLPEVHQDRGWLDAKPLRPPADTRLRRRFAPFVAIRVSGLASS